MGRSLADLKASGAIGAGTPVYSGEDFGRLAQAGTSFTITGGSYGEDDNGQTFLIDAVMESTGRNCILKFRSNPERDAQLHDILTLAADGPISGCKLVHLNMKANFPLYGFGAA